MALSNAERQARYRERHRIEADPAPKARSDEPLAVALRRIADLEAEVQHLKRELAKRPSSQPTHPFGSPRPAPKPSRSRTSASGRAG